MGPSSTMTAVLGALVADRVAVQAGTFVAYSMTVVVAGDSATRNIVYDGKVPPWFAEFSTVPYRGKSTSVRISLSCEAILKTVCEKINFINFCFA